MKKLYFLALVLVSSNTFSQGIVNSGATIVMTAGANIYVDGGTNGGYKSSGTSFIKATGGLATLSLEGDFTNNSSTTAIDGVPFSLIKMVGAAQNINGSASSTLGSVEAAGTGTKTILTKQTISNLTLNGQGVTLSDSVNLRGVLTLTSGTLTTNGRFTFISTADSTAMVATVGTGTVTGNVIAQRFIPGGAGKRKWRFLSSPINVSGSIALSQYQDDIFVTAPSGSGGGFDVNPFASNSSIRTYTESTPGTVGFGWTDPTNITNTITTGTGVEVFVRGSRNLANPFLNWTVPDNVTIDYIGTLTTGLVTKSLSFTNNSQTAADGFNLVGNPYQCTIDWQAASGWTRTNMQNFIWVYDPVLGTYGTISTTGTKSGNLNITRYIAPGQAFFVKATTTGASLEFNENIKVLETPFNFFKNAEAQADVPVLGIYVNDLNDATRSDMCLIEFNPESTMNGDDPFDATKFFNDKINLYTISDDLQALTINSIKRPETKDTIRLAFFHYDTTNIRTGAHRLRFDSVANISALLNIYLKDDYTGNTINIRNQNTYDFNLETDVNSHGNNRFKIIFDLATGISNDKLSKSLNIFPNPANKELQIKMLDSELSNSSANISITNLIGTEIMSIKQVEMKELLKLDISTLANGVYLISVEINGNVTHKKFIKN